jgi:hypothetical protein
MLQFHEHQSIKLYTHPGANTAVARPDSGEFRYEEFELKLGTMARAFILLDLGVGHHYGGNMS